MLCAERGAQFGHRVFYWVVGEGGRDDLGLASLLAGHWRRPDLSELDAVGLGLDAERVAVCTGGGTGGGVGPGGGGGGGGGGTGGGGAIIMQVWPSARPLKNANTLATSTNQKKNFMFLDRINSTDKIAKSWQTFISKLTKIRMILKITFKSCAIRISY